MTNKSNNANSDQTYADRMLEILSDGTLSEQQVHNYYAQFFKNAEQSDVREVVDFHFLNEVSIEAPAFKPKVLDDFSGKMAQVPILLDRNQKEDENILFFLGYLELAFKGRLMHAKLDQIDDVENAMNRLKNEYSMDALTPS